MKNTSSAKRLLTIGYQYQERSAKTINRHHIRVPFLRLSGKWFTQAGFLPGDIVEVESKDNSLIIRKTPNSWKVTREVHTEKFMVNEHGERIA